MLTSAQMAFHLPLRQRILLMQLLVEFQHQSDSRKQPPSFPHGAWSWARSPKTSGMGETVVANTPFTQGLRPFCLHCGTTKLGRSPLKAERRQNGCLGRSMVVHRTFRHRHERNGRREVLSMFKTVAQRSPRRSVAHRSLEGGRRKAHTSPWWQNGCTVVCHWSPCKKYVRLWTLCINLSSASAFLLPPLCLLWLTNNVHWAITVATTVPPFGDHGNPLATLAMVLPPLCLLCATCCATTADLVVQWRHKDRAVAVTQKQNFLGLGDHWATWPFFWSLKGGTKVAALCKGGFNRPLHGHYEHLLTELSLNDTDAFKNFTQPITRWWGRLILNIGDP